MVHALTEIQRVLLQAGCMVDLRPLAAGWPVQVTSADRIITTGKMSDMRSGLEDDAAAFAAMQIGESSGWFQRSSEHIFPAFIYWDDPEDMQAHIMKYWSDFSRLENPTWQATQSAWEEAEGPRHVRVRTKMLMTIWQKL